MISLSVIYQLQLAPLGRLATCSLSYADIKPYQVQRAAEASLLLPDVSEAVSRRKWLQMSFKQRVT